MNQHNEYIVIKTGARFSEQAVLMSAWSAILIMIVWTVIDMFLDLAALQQTATFQPLKKTTTTRRTPSQATTQVRCDLIIKSQHHKSTCVHRHQNQKQEERDLDGYEGGEASGQAQYQEEEEEVNSSGIAAAV